MRTLVILILLAGVGAVAGYNEYTSLRARLVAQREAIDTEWSQLDLALEQRADLLVKLAPPGRNGGPEEALWKQLLSASATLEAAQTPAAKIRANNLLSGVLDRLPQIAGGENRQRLSDADNRIAVERRRYNELLEHYNAQIQHFPDNIVASLAGFRRDDNYLPTEPGTQD